MAEQSITSILKGLKDISIDESYREEGGRVLIRAAPDSDIFLDDSVGTHRPLEAQQDNITMHKVILVRHTELDTKFRICIRGSDCNESLCDVYFDPANDCLTLKNTSPASIKILQLDRAGQSMQPEKILRQFSSRMIMSEVFRLTFAESHSIDIRIIARISLQLCSVRAAIAETSGASKRERSVSQEEFVRIKRRATNAGGKSLVKSAQQQDRPPNPDSGVVLPLTLTEGQIVDIPRDFPGGLYRISVLQQLASSRLSLLYLARHSNLEGVVVVKVLKPNRDSLPERTRSTVQQAQTWAREYRNHRNLDHVSKRRQSLASY